MNQKGMSRMSFIQGTLASMGLGFLGGRRLFAVSPGWEPSGPVRLTFGVISDTHIRIDPNVNFDPPQFWRTYTDARFRSALSYFRDQCVDAVMHCGDWGDKGNVEEMEKHKVVWDKIFPSSSYQPVKLFVLGNHDFIDDDGMSGYWDAKGKDYQDHLIRNDTKYHMDRIWGEATWGENGYSEAWHKVVKGYHFFGYHHAKEESDYPNNGMAMAKLIGQERNKQGWDVNRPFFTVSHYAIPTNVADAVTTALNLPNGQKYCNGIAFRGHGHRSSANWNAIEWPNKLCFPSLHCGMTGDKGSGGEGDTPEFAHGFGERAEGYNDRGVHGFLVKVYDDCIVISRPDFYCDTGYYSVPPDTSNNHNKDGIGVRTVGPDWVLLFDEVTSGSDEEPASHPFLETELVKSIGKPEFPEGAQLELHFEEDCIRLEIPNADGNKDASGKLLSRVYGYNVEVSGQCGVFRKSAYANGYNYGYGYEPNGGVTTVRIPKSKLPPGESLTFRVWPCSFFATKGRPLVKQIRCVRVSIEKSVSAVNRPERFAITSGARLSADTCVVADTPSWVRCVCIEDGDIVVYTRTSDGAVLRMK